MMNIAFEHPWLLLCLLTLPVPLFLSHFNRSAYPAVLHLDIDGTSAFLSRLVRLSAMLAITAGILGLSGMHRVEYRVERVGTGAHIVFVLDRSASMNETFGGKTPDDNEVSKAEAARDILSGFVQERPNDLFGVVGFSTQPFYTIPITEHKQAIQGAINSMATPGLAFTNVAKGLGMGLSYFKDKPHTGSRVVVLVSDGAATMDHRVQRTLREWFERYRVSLYWFFLRTENGNGIFVTPEYSEDDNPRVLPEKYLHKFFNTLKIPYHVYEVDTVASLENAIGELNKLESQPLTYYEQVPRHDLSLWCYLLSLLSLTIVMASKLLESGHASQA